MFREIVGIHGDELAGADGSQGRSNDKRGPSPGPSNFQGPLWGEPLNQGVKEFGFCG